jgi:hypothetical protein
VACRFWLWEFVLGCMVDDGRKYVLWEISQSVELHADSSELLYDSESDGLMVILFDSVFVLPMFKYCSLELFVEDVEDFEFSDELS